MLAERLRNRYEHRRAWQPAQWTDCAQRQASRNAWHTVCYLPATLIVVQLVVQVTLIVTFVVP